MSDTAGLVATVENLSLADFLRGSTQIPDIDELFALSTNVRRIGVETHEVKFRPGPTSSHYRGYASTSSTAADPDAALVGGVAATGPTVAYDHGQGLSLFGFAWKGVPPGGIALSFIKNIEWRPAHGAGLTIPRPIAMHSTPPAETAVRQLDNHSGGGWSLGVLGDAATQIAKTAFTGVTGMAGKYLKQEATAALGTIGAEMLEYAPLMLL
jgi:hypothetical protein